MKFFTCITKYRIPPVLPDNLFCLLYFWGESFTVKYYFLSIKYCSYFIITSLKKKQGPKIEPTTRAKAVAKKGIKGKNKENIL